MERGGESAGYFIKPLLLFSVFFAYFLRFVSSDQLSNELNHSFPTILRWRLKIIIEEPKLDYPKGYLKLFNSFHRLRLQKVTIPDLFLIWG